MSNRMKNSNQIIEVIKNTAHKYLPDKDEAAQYRGIALKVKIVIENIIKI